MTRTLAWHFTCGWKLRDGTPLEIGRTYRYGGELGICSSGLHASRRLLDALLYAPGTVVSRVECWGVGEEHDDKFVCSHRRVLGAIDAEYLLHDLACVFAEHIYECYGDDDDRCRAAIQAKRDWLRGDISDSELATAKSAAWFAASPASDTAWATARSAWFAGAAGAARCAVEAAKFAADTAWFAAEAARFAARAAVWAEMNAVAEDHILSHMGTYYTRDDD